MHRIDPVTLEGIVVFAIVLSFLFGFFLGLLSGRIEDTTSEEL
jgi:ABC-type dipeptide/oligopeptide/nickel transport system permease component